MAINPLINDDQVLMVRQRHEAKRMGLHWDYRFVKVEHAFSWATKKEMPEPGSSIVLFEQPVHDKAYAMSQRIEIPDGNYGAGVTTLDWAKKARVESHEDGTMVIHTKDQRFLLKKLDSTKYGDKAWLFKNLTGKEPMKKEAGSLLKYLKKRNITGVPWSETNKFVHAHNVDIGSSFTGIPLKERLRSFRDVRNSLEQKHYSSDSYAFKKPPTAKETGAVNEGLKKYIKQTVSPDRTKIVERQNALQNLVKKANMSNKYLEKIAKISIDPTNKGKLHKAMGEPEGKKLSTSSEESVKAKAKASGNVKLEREAQFAINAKSWKKK